MNIIPSNQHSVSQKRISANALKVLYRLGKAGYEAYLVGGGVRDLLLGKKPKDFDITTNATPQQIRKLFRNCRKIGRRFQLIHVIFNSEIIEVATFRGNHQARIISMGNKQRNVITGHHGLLLQDNVFGSIEEDAFRRDFSVNSLYYKASDSTVRDYTGGMKDLQNGTIRLIGDPETRYREDPVRMLRAIRFSVRLNMTMSYKTAEPIPRLAVLLRNIPRARLFDEALKLLKSGYGKSTYQLLNKYQLFQVLFPSINCNITQPNNAYMKKLILRVLSDIDQRLHNDIHVNSAFLFATMLWYPLLEHVKRMTQNSCFSYFDAFSMAMNNIVDQQCETIAIPKQSTIFMQDMWKLQIKLTKTKNRNNHLLIEDPKFLAAYDLLTLRAEVENNHNLHYLSRLWGNLGSKQQLLNRMVKRKQRI